MKKIELIKIMLIIVLAGITFGTKNVYSKPVKSIGEKPILIIHVKYQKDLLSINAESLTLKELCGEISKTSGIEIVLDKEIENQKISVKFNDLRFKEGIEKIIDLTGLKNLAISYKQVEGGYKINKVEIGKRGKEEDKKEEAKKEEVLPETYIKKEILFIPWGDAADKFKLEREIVEDGKNRIVKDWPDKLEIDKNEILYIWENKKYRALKYIKENSKVDNNGGKYIYDSSIPLQTRLNPHKGKIVLDESSVITEKDKFNGNYQYEFIENEEGSPFAFINSNTRKWVIGVRIMDNNKILGNAIFKDSYVRPLDIDMEGNIFLLLDDTHVEVLGQKEWRLEILKYSKEGKLLTKVELDTNWIYKLSERDRIRIDKNGNIYQLIFNLDDKNDGVHIIKWEMKK